MTNSLSLERKIYLLKNTITVSGMFIKRKKMRDQSNMVCEGKKNERKKNIYDHIHRISSDLQKKSILLPKKTKINFQTSVLLFLDRHPFPKCNKKKFCYTPRNSILTKYLIIFSICATGNGIFAFLNPSRNCS